ncbi:MAG: helix-turn-helix domain-containing protein [Terricaulis sp.]|nr:helix-turn-helix domain-containing protein [Terricaulis sp.]
MITAGQIRAARGLLDWSQQDLAGATKLSVQTIKRMEGGRAVRREARTRMWKRFDARLRALGLSF